ncbi:MAG: hypothetical protein ACTSVZ_06915 [Promethearchaeota archaeon]
MTIEMSASITTLELCPKCGSEMVTRRRISHNRPVMLLQCKVCRHYVVIDQE